MRSLVERKRVFALLPAFFALGWVLYAQVFEVKKQALSREYVSSTPTVSQGRKPASLQPQSQFVITFDCQSQKVQNHHSKFDLLRVVGRNCPRDEQIDVKHVQHQLSADVFWMEKHSFSTDLFHLKKGKNEIQVAYKKQGRRVFHHIKVGH